MSWSVHPVRSLIAYTPMEKILFACDFSPSSNRALEFALDLVERSGAHLHFRYVQEVPPGPLVGGNPSPKADSRQLQNEFEERCRDALRDASRVPPDDQLSFSVQRSEEVAPALVEFADDQGADLIVMGTHGRRGVQCVFFGSTAEEVLRTAPCPVLTARMNEAEGGAVTDPTSVERLVVPIDFSEASRSALRYASQLSAFYQAPRTLVHVVELPDLPPAYEMEFTESDAQAAQERVRGDLKTWGRSVETEEQALSYVVESGDPAPTILRVASEPEDLLVMATQGRSGLKRTMLDSVAEDILRRADGPVLASRTFPPEEGETGG